MRIMACSSSSRPPFRSADIFHSQRLDMRSPGGSSNGLIHFSRSAFFRAVRSTLKSSRTGSSAACPGVGTLGYAQYLPKERFLFTTEQLLDRMVMTLSVPFPLRTICGTHAPSEADGLPKRSCLVASLPVLKTICRR